MRKILLDILHRIHTELVNRRLLTAIFEQWRRNLVYHEIDRIVFDILCILEGDDDELRHGS